MEVRECRRAAIRATHKLILAKQARIRTATARFRQVPKGPCRSQKAKNCQGSQATELGRALTNRELLAQASKPGRRKKRSSRPRSRVPTSQNPQLQKYPCATQPGSLQDSRTVQGVEPEPPTAHSPIIDIELRNPKGWQEAVIRRQN